MAFQYPESKYEYLRDIGKGTPFTIVHKAVQKTLGLKTAMLVAELEWGFSRHEHSTAKNAHYGMPRYITTPKNKNKYIPVLADKCEYASARSFRNQFSSVGEYYGTLTEYFDKVNSGEDPFNKKPYLCIYNRKNHYARFMRNPIHAKHFFIDRLNGTPTEKTIKSSALFSKLQDGTHYEQHSVQDVQKRISCTTINYNYEYTFNPITTYTVISNSISSTEEEVLAVSFASGVQSTVDEKEIVGKVKTKTLESLPEICHWHYGVFGASNFKENNSEGYVVIKENKPMVAKPKSSAKLSTVVSSGELVHHFEGKPPKGELDTSAYSFNSAKKAPALNAQTLYLEWAKATLEQHPEMLLKPPTKALFGMCNHIIKGSREHFEDDSILGMLRAFIKGWASGVIQVYLSEQTPLFTFHSTLELPFILKYLTYFMTWYNEAIEASLASQKASVTKTSDKKSLQTPNHGVQSSNTSTNVKKPANPDYLIKAVNSAGITYDTWITAVGKLSGYKKSFEWMLARASQDVHDTVTIDKLTALLKQYSVDLDASLAKVEYYKDHPLE